MIIIISTLAIPFSISAYPIVGCMPTTKYCYFLSGASDALYPNGFAKSVGLVRQNFGTGSERHLTVVNSTFQLENASTNTITITELRPSCGCTTAILGSNAKLPLTLAPGTSIPIQVSIDAFHLTPGKIDKTVAVYVKGRKEPFMILEVMGTILPTVSFSPEVVDFGRVDAGQQRTIHLDVAYDASLEASGGEMALTSSNPNVTVASSSAVPSEPKPAKAVDLHGLRVGGTGAVIKHRTYDVTYAPGNHLGVLLEKITAVYRDGKSQTADMPLSTVSVSGGAVGEIAASPAVVAFGMVTQGKTGSQTFIIQGKSLDGLTTESPLSYLSVKLGEVHKESGAFARPFGAAATGKTDSQNSGDSYVEATVMLGASAPAGPVTSNVTVTTADGQVLALPVFGMVSAGRL